jgi:hypothetical protein
VLAQLLSAAEEDMAAERDRAAQQEAAAVALSNQLAELAQVHEVHRGAAQVSEQLSRYLVNG